MSHFRLSLLVSTVILHAAAPSLVAQQSARSERFAEPSNALMAREELYWKRVTLPAPADVLLEVSGILPVSGKRLLVTTRRGKIYWVDGAYDAVPPPRYTLFASGLHEPLGIIVAPKGGYYVAQRHELTRLVDTDGDGRCDVYETICKFPISGNYHEYAFGPVMGPDGNLRVTLNVAFGAGGQSPVPWRGWMLEITPDGKVTPIAAGLRSPAGLILTSKGTWLYTENQGEWAGSGRITEVHRGDFMGHQASLAWTKLPGSPVSLGLDDITSFEKPMVEVAQSIPSLRLPTVWLPHTVFGISNSGIIEDRTGGKFGPFAGQFFVGDQGQSKIMRVSLEQVNGVWQGAAYAFREGFQSGILRLAHGEDGSLFVGETNRGWGSVGPKDEGLERLVWTGANPFEVKAITAQSDGFLLTFTAPVDRATAEDPASYAVAGFTYLYHKTYGSPPINRLACPIRKIVVAPDGLSIRLAVGCLRAGYLHEIKALGVRSAQSVEPLLHPTAYYTLNQIPAGHRIIPLDPKDAELCVVLVPASAGAPTAKHPTAAPSSWTEREGGRTLTLGTQPGLKFDQTELTVPAGATVQFVFRNTDDMLHNFVLCAPGTGQAVGTAALTLGIEGTAKNYVPDSTNVLFHTALVQPGSSDRIYFTAPTTPGDYDYICSFPGHALLMKGVLRVTAK